MYIRTWYIRHVNKTIKSFFKHLESDNYDDYTDCDNSFLQCCLNFRSVQLHNDRKNSDSAAPNLFGLLLQHFANITQTFRTQ